MLASLSPSIRRFAKSAGLSAFLGSLLGYTVFYTTFPNASVPAVGEPNPIFAFGPLFGSAILVGIFSDDLSAAVVQAFFAIPVGGIVASVLVLSPVLAGLIIAQPGDVVFFILRSGFPLFLASVPINLICVVLGIGLREKLRLGRL